jgi:hypothetical protein
MNLTSNSLWLVMAALTRGNRNAKLRDRRAGSRMDANAIFISHAPPPSPINRSSETFQSYGPRRPKPSSGLSGRSRTSPGPTRSFSNPAARGQFFSRAFLNNVECSYSEIENHTLGFLPYDVISRHDRGRIFMAPSLGGSYRWTG